MLHCKTLIVRQTPRPWVPARERLASQYGMALKSLGAAAACIAALLAPSAHAAATAQPITATQQSIAANESQVFSVRFLTSAGAPAAGESVVFSNDACGTFPNGQFVYATQADASGVASARFTAFAQGIVCHVTASAGASTSFTVLTYLPRNVYLAVTLDPPEAKPGTPVEIKVTPAVGLYPIYNADVTASIVAGTGRAALTPGVANNGQRGSVAFEAMPAGTPGDYEVELRFRDLVQRVPVKLSPTPWQDMWWGGPAENGWGMSVVQHGDTLFSVIYAYDAKGAPTWYVMPGGTWNAAHTVYSGPIYHTHGTPFTAYDASHFKVGDAAGAPTWLVMPSGGWTDAQTYTGRIYRTSGPAWLGTAFDASQVKTTDVGSFRLRFTGDAAASFDYVVDGQQGSLPLARQPF